jgi:hypothetical protein
MKGTFRLGPLERKMTILRLPVTVAFFVMATCPATIRAQVHGSRQSSPQPRFSIQIAAAEGVVKVGSAVLVDVTLTNTSNEEVWLNMGSWVDYQFVLRDESDRDLPTKPPGSTRIEDLPLGSDRFLPMPGKIFKEQLLVSRLYDLQPGKYTIQVQRVDTRTRWVSNGKTIEVKHEGVGPNPVATSNTITITVTP